MWPYINPMMIVRYRCNRERKIFKHTRGVLIGWQLEEVDEQMLRGKDGAQVVLGTMPRYLFVRVNEADFEVHPELGRCVFPLKPTSSSPWTVDRAGHLQVIRHGFLLVPDFAGTAHSYTGATLDAANGDVGQWHDKPTREHALRAYITVSRVEEAGNLNIVQPYPPMLFRQGPQPGPHILMEMHRGNIKPEDVKAAWDKAESSHGKLKTEKQFVM